MTAMPPGHLRTVKLIEHDRRLAQRLNRASSHGPLLIACRIASRLGDGMLWYVLILVLPLVAGVRGWLCSEHMLLAGVISLAMYKGLKHLCCRPRPYMSCPDIRVCGRVLDQFSFPSGHTFHAVGFSLCLVYYFPVGAALLVPIVLLIALSRVVLGLHYPSDVVAGACCGVVVGLLSVWLI
jgi:undecaprenyl-diphosphatase